MGLTNVAFSETTHTLFLCSLPSQSIWDVVSLRQGKQLQEKRLETN